MKGDGAYPYWIGWRCNASRLRIGQRRVNQWDWPGVEAERRKRGKSGQSATTIDKTTDKMARDHGRGIAKATAIATGLMNRYL